MVMSTLTPRSAAATMAPVIAEDAISSFSIDNVCLAPLITASIWGSEPGLHTRSVPAEGVTGLWAKSASKTPSMEATSAALVSTTPKSRVVV